MAKKPVQLDENGKRKFDIRDCLAYAAGDLGCNMSFALKSTMAIFWTQFMQLDLWYSLLLIIVQVWDAINDPLIGSIVDADKHKYKRNKFLTYIWAGSIGLIVGGACCFLPFPNAPVWAKIIIFIAGYVVWDAFYTVANVPYGSLLSLISSKPADRASLSAWRSVGSIGGSDEDLLENHRILNNMCHEMDKTRLTTIAAVSMCKMDDPYLQIPDLVSYNHYFGWYGGETGMNGPWFDKFHETHPNIPIGCSEYGCEALNWHTSNPMQGDYTEEYQAYYHEELIKQFFSRKYMWATHVWNMFDFGADARNEGGENGQNHKGLVTMDRKYKKDAFYAYKAWLSDDPFVHLCGKRYIDRVEDVTKVTVYSNLPEVELFANGVSLGKKAAADHFFYFDVPNAGETKLVAVAGEYKDESCIRKVDTFNESYRLVEKGAVLNWFDIDAPEGYLSLNDKMSDVIATMQGKLLFMTLMGKFLGGGKKDGDGKIKAAGFEVGPEMMSMMGGFTVLRLFTLMGGMMDVKFTKEQLLDLNAKLNKIKKPKEKK